MHGAVAGGQRLPDPVLAVQLGPYLRELSGHQRAGHLPCGMATEPIGKRDYKLGAKRNSSACGLLMTPRA